MTEIINNEAERAILVSVDCGEFDAQTSLDELSELAATAGAEPVATLTQKRNSPDSATCIGSGRLEEIKLLCENDAANLIIFDCELSPVQLRNLENETNVRVVDRTMLILDIFASRAQSIEGKLQVELAQLRYMLPRLTGLGISLSRLGAGIGTRGPGESKLETDRRHIRRRIDTIKEKLADVEKRRNSLRARRKKTGIQSVAIVGYTNAGKSTLMNTLTGAGVLVEDKLFATLDPTARALRLPDGRSVMLIDTVGLVRRLPHHLIEAFKSTLEEAASADVILNVCDASSPDAPEHLEVTMNLLSSLGCGDIPVITVLNKCDLPELDVSLFVTRTAIRISALNGEGLDLLMDAIVNAIPVTQRHVKLLLPFSLSGIPEKIRRDGIVYSEKYTAEGLLVDGLVDIVLLEQIKQYITE